MDYPTTADLIDLLDAKLADEEREAERDYHQALANQDDPAFVGMGSEVLF